MKNILTFLTISLMAFHANAELPRWRIIPEKSTLSFTATNAGEKIEGRFTRISGDISFDPARPGEGSAKIEIDMNSLASHHADALATLPGEAWFDTKNYAKAIFISKGFRALKEKQFAVDGTLTLHGVVQPVTVTFALEKFDPKTGGVAVARGQAVLKRTDFKVGQGEWANTDAVADKVAVDAFLTTEFMP